MRVTVIELEMAAEFLDTYDASDDDPNGERCRRVAAWLRDEIARRENGMVVREIAKRAGVSTARAKAALIKVRSR
jgi:hypothetical protein